MHKLWVVGGIVVLAGCAMSWEEMDRRAKAQNTLEYNDPDMKALMDATAKGQPPPADLDGRLARSCTYGNRHSCLVQATKKYVKDHDFEAYRQSVAKIGKSSYDGMQFFALRVYGCILPDNSNPDARWQACEDVKATFNTRYRWGGLGGLPLKELFPAGPPPPRFSDANLAAVPPGKGWSCVDFGVVTTRYIDEHGAESSHQGLNSGLCFRTVGECEALRQSFRPGPDMELTGVCKPYDDVAYMITNEASPGQRSTLIVRDEEACKFLDKATPDKKTCIPVGDAG